MKKIFQRSLAILLCVLMFAQSAYAAELIDAYTPEYKYFSTMEVPQDYADENLFWFGSTSMTLSETDPDYYLMRVLRGGDCADEASVTLKFTDVTAAYGTNYRVWAYDSDAEVTGLENNIPMVDFLQQNAKNQYEGEPLNQEDVIAQMQTPEGAVLKDGSGESLATLRLTEKAEDGTIQTVSAESNDTVVVNAADYAAIDAEQETLYSEEYPGKELTLTFAPGETEKLVAVDPKYSTANDGDCMVMVSLRNPSVGMAYLEESMTTSITITDEDVAEPAVLSIAQENYFADSDTVEVTVTRSGAVNEMVCANIVTVSDEGEIGVDFQGADATLYFPMGIQERTVSLQVNHIRDEQVDFQVKLVNPQGCTVDRAEATVTIATPAEVEEALLMEEAAAEKQMMAASVLEGSAASVTLNALSNMPSGTAAETAEAAEADDAAAALAEEPETEAAAAAAETPAAATAAAEAAPAAAEAAGEATEAAAEAESAENAENAENALPASDNDYSDIPYVDTDPAYAPAGTGTDAAEAAESDDDYTVELCEDILCLPSSSYRITEIPNTNFVGFGKGWKVGEQAYHYSCYDVAHDTWNGMEFYLDNPYLYDGIRTRITGDHEGPFCISYFHIKIDGENKYSTEDDDFNRRVDVIFGKESNSKVRFEALTSYWSGLYGDVEWVAPIYREFKFTLKNAAPLEFAGVDAETAMDYTASTMRYKKAGDNSDKTVTECTLSIGDVLTISAPSSQEPYARLTAVQFLDRNNNVLFTADNTTNSRSVTVTLTKDVLNALATKDTEFKKNTVNGKDCFIGQISVRPVYKNIPATVIVQTNSLGSFNDPYKTTDAPLTLEMNLGDRIKLSSTVYSQYARKYVASGVRYELRDGENKTIVNGSGTLDYDANGELTFTVTTQNLVLEPVFTANDNVVQVWVKTTDLKSFNTDNALFKCPRQTSGSYSVYTVSAESVHMDTMVPLTAKTADAVTGKVPLWSVGGKTYSGNDFIHVTGRTKESNKIILSLGNTATYQMTGCAYHADKNLSTGISSANPIVPANDAVVSCAGESAYVMDDGSFYLDEVKGAADTWARLLVFSGNSWVTKDVYLHDDEQEINLGIITTAANTTDTACFTNIFAWQDSYLVTDAEVLQMNSKELKLTAVVKDNVSYLVGGETRTEKVTGVSFYVVDGTTHQVKSEIKATQEEAGVWIGKIEKFTPDKPDSWYYGDVIYVSMSTDRVASLSLDENFEIIENMVGTTYAMLSTGYQIGAGNAEYDPQTFSFDPGLDADSMMGDSTLSEETSDSARKTRGYTQLPYLGAINAFIGVSGIIADANGEESNDGTYTPSTGGMTSDVSYRITFSFDDLPYGGTRMKIGVIARKGNTAASAANSHNPYAAYMTTRYTAEKKSNPVKINENAVELITNHRSYNSFDQQKGTMGVPRMTFIFMFGFFVDFGVVTEISDAGGDVESHVDGVYFLGAGGYAGFGGSVEFQWMFMAGPVPMYAGLIGEAGLTAYLGNQVDPAKQLDMPVSQMYDEKGNMTFDNLELTLDTIGSVGVKGYLGVGGPDVLGARVIVGLTLTFNTCPQLKEYYHAITDDYGLGLELSMGGQIDLVIISIPFEGLSIPLYNMGFTEYFVYVKRAYRLWDYILQELEENPNKYSEAQKAQVNEKLDLLVDDMNNGVAQAQFVADYQDAEDYADGLGMLSTREMLNLHLITPLDVWTLEDDTAETVTETAAASEEMLTEDGYVLMQHTDSAWVADESVALSGSFREASTQTLVNWSYSQTNPSIVDIGNGNLLAIFLQDTSSAGEAVDPTLVYSVYNVDSERWTRPVAVADDGTADYTPHLCDAGDQVILTWSSAGIADTSNANAVLESMEIWTATFDKATRTMGTPVQLTNDSYMDYNPQAIYDNETGDLAVYYVKHQINAEEDIRNYVVGKSVLCYRLYDADSGQWVIDYYEGEISTLTEEERHEYGVANNGQRYLNSAVSEDKPITNLTVADGYNGLGIYAYTVDLDGDTTDNSDTELYLRLYDFRTHKTYAPIRVTNDNVSQGMPQLIRTSANYQDNYEAEDGTQVSKEINGTTYLFWLEDDNTVKYINATDLLRHGINADGTMVTGYNKDGITPISFESENGYEKSLNNYEALTDDEGNLYLVWSQAAESADEEKNEDIHIAAPEELYAAALIQEEPEAVQITDDGVEGGIDGSSWSQAVRLTTDESHNDGATGVIGDDGTLYMLHNQYDISYVGFAEDAAVDEETGCIEGNPYEIGDTRLCFSTFEPIATVDATEFTFSDETPAPGDTIQVTAKLENTGLTTAKGYTAVFSECRNGVAGNVLHTASQEEWLVANEADYVTFDWTVPEDFDQVTIQCAGYEQGYSEPAMTYSEALEKTAAYEVSIGNVIQNGDKFTVDYTITNTGSLTAGADEVLRAEFAGLYGQYDTIYSLETDKLGEISITGLAPNETISGVMEISVPEQAFDYCGYDAVELTVYNGEGTALSKGVSNYMVLNTPVEATAEAKTDLAVGDTEKINAILKSGFFSKRGYKPYYSSDNNAVATVSEDGTITAKGAGSAAITVTFAPYGTTAELQVKVAGDENTRKFVDVPDTSYYASAVYWGVANGIVSGTSKTTFSPNAGCTRAQFVSFLWRAAGRPEPESTTCSFTDVASSQYYYKAVLWGVENKIISGTSKTTFSPNEVCTRAQAVTFLWRYNGRIQPDSETCKFTDVPASQYYYKPVLWGAENKIVSGTSKTTFSPNEKCTRGQAITFLYRLLKNN